MPPLRSLASAPSPGDGEDLLASFTERLLQLKGQLAGPGGAPPPRRELLLALAQVPGVYVPQVGGQCRGEGKRAAGAGEQA